MGCAVWVEMPDGTKRAFSFCRDESIDRLTKTHAARRFYVCRTCKTQYTIEDTREHCIVSRNGLEIGRRALGEKAVNRVKGCRK